METINVIASWSAILTGFILGAVPGLSFHKEDWLGGYASWPRRLMRLGHISFFGLAFINLAFVFTVRAVNLPEADKALPSLLFVIGLATMPLVCYLSAFWKRGRFLFPIPVVSLIVGAGALLLSLIRHCLIG